MTASALVTCKAVQLRFIIEFVGGAHWPNDSKLSYRQKVGKLGHKVFAL